MSASEYAYIFVYGTLMAGERNHDLMGNSQFVRYDAITNACLFNLGEYPMMIAGSGTVYGEVYQVAIATIPILDELEEHPSYYYRQEVLLQSGYLAWAYFGRESTAIRYPLIPSGNWRKVK